MVDLSGELVVETSTFASVISFNRYQEARIFQLQLCALASSRADSAGVLTAKAL
jgi:hypothetical protein